MPVSEEARPHFRLPRVFRALAGRILGSAGAPREGEERLRSRPSFAETLSIFSLIIALVSAFFAFSQLRLANEAQLTPFRMSLFTAKLESYKVISAQSRAVVAASSVHEALNFNMTGVRGWAESDYDLESKGDQELLMANREAHIDEIKDELESVKPVFEKALPQLSENSVVWGGNQLQLVTLFRDIVERDLLCFEAVAAILNADPDDEHLQPLDGSSWGFTEDICKELEADQGRLAVIARKMDQAMRIDLRADRLQIVPMFENLPPD